MQTKTELARYIDQTEQDSAYDEAVKRILSTKHLLAWIMKGCVSEYKDYSIRDIVEKYIEGEPQVSSTPVHMNDSGEVIHGLDTVDKSRQEHTTLYDVLFYATLPDSTEKIGLFINIEAQNRYNPGYPLVKRGIYYCSRMISAQFGRDFADGHYEDLKKVYSIWICANAPDSRDNTITQYELTEKQVLGEAAEERKNYDLLSVVMVCFNDKRIKQRVEDGMDGEYPADLVRLLSVLLSSKVEREEKKQILADEYKIPMTRELESEVSLMCNLSKGIKEQGLEQGLAQGLEQGLEQGAFNKAMKIALELLKMNLPAANIAKATELSLEQIKEIAEANQLELVTE